MLISLGVPGIDAIRVAALANNAPVSFDAPGVPIVVPAAVTGLPPMHASAAIGPIVAALAPAAPWLLMYLVSGTREFRTGWPLALVGASGYITGPVPVAEWVEPRLRDVTGAIVSFGALFLLLKVWRRRAAMRGFGGRVLSAHEIHAYGAGDGGLLIAGRVIRSIVPCGILVVVVVLWTGPGSIIGESIAPQGCERRGSTTGMVCKAGAVIRHNMGWPLDVLAYLALVGCLFYCVFPGALHFQ